MFQPFLEEIRTQGEWSLLYIFFDLAPGPGERMARAIEAQLG